MPDTAIPRLGGFEHTLAFLRDGYAFVSRNCDALGTDRFRARIMLTPVLCARGASAARMFYAGDRFTRQGAMPPTVLRLLQDKGSVQGLDGAAHRHRKRLFIDLLMREAGLAELVALFEEEWLTALADWATRPGIVVFDEANLVLTRAVCRWAGVPLDGIGDVQMCHALSSMIENAGSIGPVIVPALLRRRRTERQIAALVERSRAGLGRTDTALWRIAHFEDAEGVPLSVEAAAVEVINILRPTVAIGRYIMFAAMALHQHRSWRVALHGADDAHYARFAEEVRRVYPFFPVVGGIAKASFDWEGAAIAEGDWVLLDLYGTNHDPRRFAEPGVFDPTRAPSWRRSGLRLRATGRRKGTPETHRAPANS